MKILNDPDQMIGKTIKSVEYDEYDDDEYKHLNIIFNDNSIIMFKTTPACDSGITIRWSTKDLDIQDLLACEIINENQFNVLRDIKKPNEKRKELNRILEFNKNTEELIIKNNVTKMLTNIEKRDERLTYIKSKDDKQLNPGDRILLFMNGFTVNDDKNFPIVFSVVDKLISEVGIYPKILPLETNEVDIYNCDVLFVSRHKEMME